MLLCVCMGVVCTSSDWRAAGLCTCSSSPLSSSNKAGAVESRQSRGGDTEFGKRRSATNRRGSGGHDEPGAASAAPRHAATTRGCYVSLR